MQPETTFPVLQAVHGVVNEPKPLEEAIAALGQQSLLALRVSRELGGQALSAVEYWQVQEAIARKSGALAFLQTQHQSAANFIASGENPALKAYLPQCARGQLLVGVGFSHLRRAGAPVLTATPDTGGYWLNGTIPWATGWQFFQKLVAGAALPDGQSLIALIPFESTILGDRSIHCSAPMELSAFSETNTVSMELKNWWVGDAEVIAHKPVDWLKQADRRNVLKSSSLAMGCAAAALDLMAETIRVRQMHAAESAWLRLEAAIASRRQAILTELAEDESAQKGSAFVDGEERYEMQLALRGRAIALMGRCVQGAIAITGGAANSPYHPAQQLHRESVVFAVSGQSDKTATAIINALANFQDIC